MSLKIVALLATVVGIAGIAIGYYLRLIISLGKRGSMELEIKEMMFKAKEDEFNQFRLYRAKKEA